MHYTAGAMGVGSVHTSVRFDATASGRRPSSGEWEVPDFLLDDRHSRAARSGHSLRHFWHSPVGAFPQRLRGSAELEMHLSWHILRHVQGLPSKHQRSSRYVGRSFYQVERTGIEPVTPCLQSRAGPPAIVGGRWILLGSASAPPASVGRCQPDELQGTLQPHLAPPATQHYEFGRLPRGIGTSLGRCAVVRHAAPGNVQVEGAKGGAKNPVARRAEASSNRRPAWVRPADFAGGRDHPDPPTACTPGS